MHSNQRIERSGRAGEASYVWQAISGAFLGKGDDYDAADPQANERSVLSAPSCLRNSHLLGDSGTFGLRLWRSL